MATSQPLNRVLQWLDTVDRHQSGILDAPTTNLTAWPTIDRETSLRDAKN